MEPTFGRANLILKRHLFVFLLHSQSFRPTTLWLTTGDPALPVTILRHFSGLILRQIGAFLLP